MLRITTNDDGSLVHLGLEGRLVTDWVIEAENAWRAAHIPGRALRVDLTAVTSIDDDGWRLLKAMKEAGAVFVTEGVGMKHLIKERTSKHSRTGSRRPSRILCVFMLIIGAAAGTARAQAGP